MTDEQIEIVMYEYNLQKYFREFSILLLGKKFPLTNVLSHFHQLITGYSYISHQNY